MEMRDQGTKRDRNTTAIDVPSNGKDKYYPTTYISSEKLPGIEKYDIGHSCKLCSVVKVIGKREKEDGEVEVEVEIHKMGIMGKGPVPKEEYDNMTSEEKDEADEKEVLGEDE